MNGENDNIERMLIDIIYLTYPNNSDSNALYSDSNALYSDSNALYSDSNALYSDSNALYSDINEVYYDETELLNQSFLMNKKK